MEVHVTFVGLCMFVPDPAGSHMHVLLPKSGGSHQHDVQVFYPGIEPGRPKFNRVYLDLTPLRENGVFPHRLDHMLDVEDVVGYPVSRDTTGADTREKVFVRISLPPADDVRFGPTAVWNVIDKDGNTHKCPLTHQVTWIIRSADICPVKWELKPLHGSGNSQVLGRPIPDPDGVIRISVVHLPLHPHRTNPQDPTAPHADLYYQVSGHPGELPTLASEPDLPCAKKDGASETDQLADGWRSEIAYNCMLGKSGAG